MPVERLISFWSLVTTHFLVWWRHQSALCVKFSLHTSFLVVGVVVVLEAWLCGATVLASVSAPGSRRTAGHRLMWDQFLSCVQRVRLVASHHLWSLCALDPSLIFSQQSFRVPPSSAVFIFSHVLNCMIHLKLFKYCLSIYYENVSQQVWTETIRLPPPESYLPD